MILGFAGKNHVLQIHGVDYIKWAKEHNLKPFTVVCDGCGKDRTTSIPFVSGKAYGLVCPPCECNIDENLSINGFVHSPPYCVTFDMEAHAAEGYAEHERRSKAAKLGWIKRKRHGMKIVK